MSCLDVRGGSRWGTKACQQEQDILLWAQSSRWFNRVDHKELKSVVCTLTLEDIKGRRVQEREEHEGSAEGMQKSGWMKRMLPINGDLIEDGLHVFRNWEVPGRGLHLNLPSVLPTFVCRGWLVFTQVDQTMCPHWDQLHFNLLSCRS